MNKLSKDEERLVAEELAERLKDIVYARASKEASRTVSTRGNSLLNDPTGNRLDFTFIVTMYAGDVQQIVARARRMKGGAMKT